MKAEAEFTFLNGVTKMILKRPDIYRTNAIVEVE